MLFWVGALARVRPRSRTPARKPARRELDLLLVPAGRTRSSRRRRRAESPGVAVSLASDTEAAEFLRTARSLLAKGDNVAVAQLAGARLAQDRGQVPAWEMLGAASHATGQYDHAAACFSAASQLEPSRPRHLVNLAAALLAAGELVAAEEAARSGLKLDVQSARAHTMLATVRQAAGDTEGAEAGFLRALESDESNVDARIHLAQLWTRQGRVDDAIAACRRAIDFEPNASRAWASLATALMAWHDCPPRELEAVCRRAYELDGNSPRNLNNLAVVWIANGRRNAAKGLLLSALKLDPDCAAALNNLAEMLTQEGAVEEALVLAQRALHHDPSRPAFWGTLGNAQAAAENYVAAAESFERGITLGGPTAPIELSRGMLRLRHGDWRWGWRDYHARFRTREFAHMRTEVPLWQPSRDRGKVLLLRCEQGAGDSLQFIRFARLLRAAGVGETWLECPKRLMPMLATAEGIDVIFETDEVPEGYDVQCPLMSLPMQLGLSLTSLDDFQPYLRAEPRRIQAWRDRVVKAWPNRLRVGINWCGAKKPVADPREIPLACFARLAELPGVELISLQRGRGASQLDTSVRPDWLHEFSELDSDRPYADTAALAHALDLVITSDTSVPHLVGALGQPVWLLLPRPCEWRWMDKTLDTPWYPSMRLFRQQQSGDWPELFERVAKALRQQLQRRAA